MNAVFHDTGCACAIHDGKGRDPTGTSTISKRFAADVTRRFRALQTLVIQSLVRNDALGLKKPILGFDSKNPQPIVQITRDRALDQNRYAFARSSEKVSGFMGWLREQERQGILGVMEGTQMEYAASTAWSNVYIQAAYMKGVKDAAVKLRAAGARVAASWVDNSLSRGLHADRTGLAYTRTFTELEGITDTMDQAISRVLAEGLSNGLNPMQIARNINNRIDKIGITRARMLARTEVINAHANATLNGFQEAGIEGVDVETELLITLGACEECEAIAEEGPYTLEEARGLIPAHPNCRCAWAPKVINGTGIELV